MSLKIIVLAKQVPDTRNVGKDAMKEDGTINRAALPAIFRVEDCGKCGSVDSSVLFHRILSHIACVRNLFRQYNNF